MDIVDSVRSFLEDYGVWTLLILLLAKFATGVIVAIDKNEFKWYYLGNTFKTDFLKVVTFAILLGIGRFAGIEEFDNDYLQGGMGLILAADLTAGVIKNVAHLIPSFADGTPSSLREPARLRLGNPRNLQ
jgi:hypothetical protein